MGLLAKRWIMCVTTHMYLICNLTMDLTQTSNTSVSRTLTCHNYTHIIIISSYIYELYGTLVSIRRLAKCGVDQGDFLSGHFTFSKCDKVKKKVS